MVFINVGDMQPPLGKAFLAEQTLHHPAARKRILHVKLINPAHQFKVLVADRARFMVQAAPADPNQLGFSDEAQGVIATCHCFALAGRPALASAPLNKIILKCQLADLRM